MELFQVVGSKVTKVGRVVVAAHQPDRMDRWRVATQPLPMSATAMGLNFFLTSIAS